TWQQGRFVDQKRYSKWPPEEKARADREERCRVRSSPTGDAIAVCFTWEAAEWIASRLNLAATLERSPGPWTTEKPTVVGWYWWDPQGPRAIASCSYGGSPLIVEIDEQGWDKKLYMADGSAYGENPLVEDVPGRWAGPIPFPAESA
ncbi:MAG: hypothetical protein ABL994_24490, partial [Verrucomicrobiales bacterium]